MGKKVILIVTGVCGLVVLKGAALAALFVGVSVAPAPDAPVVETETSTPVPERRIREIRVESDGAEPR